MVVLLDGNFHWPQGASGCAERRPQASHPCHSRDVAQTDRALGLGPGCRGFESLSPDQDFSPVRLAGPDGVILCQRQGTHKGFGR